jgi:hypothetical protein
MKHKCPEDNLYSLKMWIETDQKLVQTLTRTWKLHSSKSLGKGYELYTQNLSCYCDTCVNGQNSECENVDIVSNWEKRNLDIMGKYKESKYKEKSAHL